MKLFNFSFICVIFIATLSGCAWNKPSGAIFNQHQLSNSDKALVYVYRPLGETLGHDRTYFLMINEHKVVDLLHGGYFPYEANPGKLTMLSDVNKSVRMMIPLIAYALEASINPDAAKLEIEVKAGKTYYVKMHPKTHFAHFEPRLTLVTSEIGKNEIRNCQLILPADY